MPFAPNFPADAHATQAVGVQREERSIKSENLIAPSTIGPPHRSLTLLGGSYRIWA